MLIVDLITNNGSRVYNIPPFLENNLNNKFRDLKLIQEIKKENLGIFERGFNLIPSMI